VSNAFASLKDGSGIQGQKRSFYSVYCDANRPKGTINQFSTALKIQQVYCVPMEVYACQIGTKPPLFLNIWVLLNNDACRVLRYNVKNRNFRQHRVTRSGKTFVVGETSGE